MIGALLQQPLSILPRRKAHIEQRHKLSSEETDFHQCEILSDATEWTAGEGLEGVFVENEVWAS